MYQDRPKRKCTDFYLNVYQPHQITRPLKGHIMVQRAFHCLYVSDNNFCRSSVIQFNLRRGRNHKEPGLGCREGAFLRQKLELKVLAHPFCTNCLQC